MLTYEFNRVLDREANVAENRFSYLYAWNMINGGIDEGSLPIDALQVGYHNGMMLESDFPVQSSAYQFRWASGYDKYLRAIHYRIRSLDNITISSPEELVAMKRYLFNGGVEGQEGKLAVFSSGASGWRFDDSYEGPSETGYKSLLTSLPTGGSHAMTIVGYDDTVECTIDGEVCYGAFIVANSHGSWAHDNGRYYLPYKFFLKTNDTKYMLSKDVTGLNVEYYQPSLVFKVGIDFSSRNDLCFRMGVANKPYAEVPSSELIVGIARNQGGEYPMQGSGASSKIEFAFNASALVDYATSFDEPKYFINVNRGNIGTKNGNGKMESFAVYDYRNDEQNPTVYECNVGDGTLVIGDNLFGVATTPLITTSASAVDWLNSNGKPSQSPFVVRTAKGRYAKVRFVDYDRTSGTLSIKYVYAPDGTTHLGN